MKKFVKIICGMAAFLLCLETVVSAQGIDREQIMRIQFRKRIDGETNAAEARMTNTIADLTRACELSDEQIVKLNVAAKGAIKSVLAPTKAAVIEQAERLGFEYDPDAPEEEDDLGPQSPNQIAQRLMVGGEGARASRASKVDQENIWVNSLDKVLTDDQRAKWTTWTDQRTAFTRKAAIYHLIALADKELLFSQEQREGMATYLEERYGDSLVANFGNSAPGRAQLILAQSLQIEEGEKTEGAGEAVKAILTESQYMLWSKNYEPQLKKPLRQKNLQD